MCKKTEITLLVFLITLFLFFFNFGCPQPVTHPNNPVQQKILVADFQNNRLIRMDNISGIGWQVYNGLPGSQKPPFPGYIKFSGGYIWMFDSWNARLLRMNDIAGNGCIEFGSYGSGPNQFNDVQSIAFDNSGRIYTADKWNHRIERFDDMSGTNWITFGTIGSGINELQYPTDITVDQTSGEILRELP